MLQVKSFKISDDINISAFLRQYRLAASAHILISNGELAIPYEDGEPMNNAQRVISIKEQKNMMLDQIFLIEHSQGVVQLQIADAENKYNVAQAAFESNKVTANQKDLTAKRDAARQQYNEAKNLGLQNDFEIVRLKRNIELFDEQIAKLSV